MRPIRPLKQVPVGLCSPHEENHDIWSLAQSHYKGNEKFTSKRGSLNMGEGGEKP